MTPEKETQLFDYICRHRPFREWLEDQRKPLIATLSSAIDIEQIRRAQGQMQFIDRIVARLDAAESAAKQR